MSEEKDIAKRYVTELFKGDGMISSYCKHHDCEDCYSSTKLFERVTHYHNSALVQHEYLKATKEAAKLFIENKKRGLI